MESQLAVRLAEGKGNRVKEGHLAEPLEFASTQGQLMITDQRDKSCRLALFAPDDSHPNDDCNDVPFLVVYVQLGLAPCFFGLRVPLGAFLGPAQGRRILVEACENPITSDIECFRGSEPGNALDCPVP
jgi:hypothetical protein